MTINKSIENTDIYQRQIVLQDVYVGMHAETELGWHCDCGLRIEPIWEYCPNCGKKLWQQKTETVTELNTDNNQWHDLRKNPDDLPEKIEDVWVILADNPTVIEKDCYFPDDKGAKYHEFVPEIKSDGSTMTVESEYISTGWYDYGRPGQVTHWMYINVPEPPKEVNNE